MGRSQKLDRELGEEPFWSTIRTPVGEILVGATEKGICAVEFERAGSPRGRVSSARSPRSRAHVEAALRQLGEYFAGKRTGFDLDLFLTGTDFEEKIWKALTRIPFGETRSYAETARAAGQPGGARAAGGAIGRNPAAIIVPCHRVIGADGSLTGFGGGLDRKRWLLEHESGARRLPGIR
jgi:methylated-DNA-[protein]-cysteine S-methyltransferase